MLGKRRHWVLGLQFIALFLFVMVGRSALYAQDQPKRAEPALPGEDCQTESLESWAPQEKWVWNQVCQGKVANFNLVEGYGGVLDPKKDKKWPRSRILSPGFLETILLHEPYRKVLTRHGIQILGAWFREPLDLSNSTLTQQLALRGCRFESIVNLNGLKTSKTISLNDSKFNGKVFIEELQTESSLFIETSEFSEVLLGSARIGGQLSMIGSNFSGRLDMDGLQVQGLLLMRNGAKFTEVVLRGAKIGDQIDMTNSAFSRKLDMDGLKVEGGLFMSNGAKFAEVVLRSAKIGDDIDMINSAFSGKLDMDGLQVQGLLLMRNGAKFTEVVLRGAKIGDQIDMTNSAFSGKLDMDGLKVEGGLFMSNGAKFAEVVLRGAKIGGDIDMTNSTFSGKLDMDGLKVEGGLFMRDGAKFAEVVLLSAKIGGHIDMTNSIFSGRLDMDGLQVQGLLLMSNGAKFAEVVLRSAKIGDQIDMTNSTFSGRLDMASIQVQDSLFMKDGAEFAEPLTLTFAKIGGNLVLSGSTIASIELTGAHVRGDFVLGPPAVRWLEGAKLTLRNTEVGALQDFPDAWPADLELDGFVYARLGGFSADDAADMSKREISWFEEWMGKQKRYSPQPYEQLARILEKKGHKDKAEQVLYAGKNRELNETTGFFNRLFLFLLKIFIGYRYRIYYAIFWVTGFVAFGVLVLRLSGQGPAHGMPYGIAYSLDMLLPIIKLRDCHYEIDLTGWARYYFYFHKIMGYVLASFLIAGLSGLTK